MKLLKLDLKNNYFQVVVENLDDLWHLGRILEKGDLVSGKSERKVKPRTEGEKATKENVFIELRIEQIQFHKSTHDLRVSGIVEAAKPAEYVELKSHHSLEINIGRKISVTKEKLKKFQIDRLRLAQKESAAENLLIVLMDDEEASFGILKNYKIEGKGRIVALKRGKRFSGEESKQNYFEKVVGKITELDPNKIIIAGPGFTKENFQKFVGEKSVKIKAHYAHLNSVGDTGFTEILKSGIIEKVTEQAQLAKETKLVETVLAELGKGNGLGNVENAEIKKAVEFGAVEKILVSEELLVEQHENVESMLAEVEEKGGEVHIISTEHEAGKQLIQFGGIAALLRYKLHH